MVDVTINLLSRHHAADLGQAHEQVTVATLKVREGVVGQVPALLPRTLLAVFAPSVCEFMLRHHRFPNRGTNGTSTCAVPHVPH